MSNTASAIFLIGRILFVALFVVSAQGHIANHDRFVTTARGRIPFPYVAGWPVGVWLVLAVLSMVLGIWPDVGALMMAAFLIPTTLLFHPFWTFSDATQRRTQRGSFFRNVSLLGASLALFAFLTVVGPGRFAITGSLFNLR
ncbi:MAG TPA: DoxX family protein [Candidatus Dormibacteraeota bacterium]